MIHNFIFQVKIPKPLLYVIFLKKKKKKSLELWSVKNQLTNKLHALFFFKVGFDLETVGSHFF